MRSILHTLFSSFATVGPLTSCFYDVTIERTPPPAGPREKCGRSGEDSSSLDNDKVSGEKIRDTRPVRKITRFILWTEMDRP